jgi:signal peptide peptidase SppA
MEEEKSKKAKFKLWDTKVDRRVLKYVFVVLLLTASLITIKDEVVWQFGDFDDSYSETETEAESESDCNVMGLELHGDIVTYISHENYDEEGTATIDETASENINYQIATAESDDNIKAIILEVDSYGGSPVAGEEIANALRRASKPTVALIRTAGASSAYLSAVGTDRIFASKNSDVGSIGVTMSYLDYSQQNQDQGISYVTLSSGKFKDAGSSDRKLTAEEKELFLRDVKIIHNNFIDLVAEYRKLDVEQVRKLADGSTMLGEMALANGLIDEIGSHAEVNNYLKELLGEEISICWP